MRAQLAEPGLGDHATADVLFQFEITGHHVDRGVGGVVSLRVFVGVLRKSTLLVNCAKDGGELTCIGEAGPTGWTPLSDYTLRSAWGKVQNHGLLRPSRLGKSHDPFPRWQWRH